MPPADHPRDVGLRRAELADDPFAQFHSWLAAAEVAGVPQPTAMTLATADATGAPNARMVLLKGVDDHGFVFHTNAGSAKGRELAANPRAALVFHWVEQGRQVRVTGRVRRATKRESDAYFDTRPYGAQLSAWASTQSEVVYSRAALEASVGAVAARYPEGCVPRPPHWGGYRLTPRSVEFWQGRENRLHDRFRYRRVRGHWVIERLAP